MKYPNLDENELLNRVEKIMGASRAVKHKTAVAVPKLTIAQRTKLRAEIAADLDFLREAKRNVEVETTL